MKFLGKKKEDAADKIAVLKGAGVAATKNETGRSFGLADEQSSSLLKGRGINTGNRAQSRSLSEGGILIAGGSVQDLEAAERFRMLRAQLERQNLSQVKTDLLAITSAVPSEGKSMVSANIARAFSSDPHGRTIIVDCDLRKPNVHRFFGESSSPGLSDLLVAGKPLEGVIRQVEPGLDIICAGSPVVDSTRTIESPGLRLLLEELRGRYKHIVLDCPPVLMCSEVLSLAQEASGTLLVARAWRTERQLVSEAADMLRNHSLIGVVLNECSDTLRHYGYYGYYGYVGASKAGSTSGNASQMVSGSSFSGKPKGFFSRLLS